MFIVGIAITAIGFMWWRSRDSSNGLEVVDVHSSITNLESLGTLNVYKVMTKEIVTASDHLFGSFGEKYFSWLISKKKLAMIFTFDIEFSYDLKSEKFKIEAVTDQHYKFYMPECNYSLSIKDISFYDEQNAKVLPWLLPDLISGVFSDGFDENDRNMLIKEAKKQVSTIAEGMMSSLQGDVQNSARTTLKQIASALQVREVEFDFTDSKSVENRVDYIAEDRVAT